MRTSIKKFLHRLSYLVISISYITLMPLPANADTVPPKSTEEEFDLEQPHQTTAYWVRVTQEDGATAWSSPTFISP